MTGHDAASSQERAETIARAAEAAASAVERIAPQAGSTGTAARLQAARRLELAARVQTQRYIRTARAEGIGWHEIGVLLGLGPDAAGDSVSVAEAAFSFAAGRRVTDSWDPAISWWDCPACGETISDHGPGREYPGDAEEGHAEGCERLAAAVAAFDATWTQEG